MKARGHLSLSRVTGQQSLHARYRTWVQVHLRALRGSVFQDWRQAAARQRRPGPSPERRLLHRWVGLGLGG